MSELTDFRVAILATHGVEESELTEPVKALRDAGARVTIKAPATSTNPAATADGAIHDQRAPRPPRPCAAPTATSWLRSKSVPGGAALSGASTVGSWARRSRSDARKTTSPCDDEARSSERSTSPISW